MKSVGGCVTLRDFVQLEKTVSQHRHTLISHNDA